MEIVKIIGIAFSGVFISILLKQYRPEFVVYISILTSILILLLILPKFTAIVEILNQFIGKLEINIDFFKILLKITGITYLAEFATNICKDVGENAIAVKVEMGAKILIISMAIPILGSILDMVLEIFPK